MINNFKIIKKQNIIFFYIITAFLFTLYILGLDYVNPNNQSWLFENDRASDLLVWKYFFNDEWRFPLGGNKNFGLDISNSIVYSGSPPLLSFFFKIFKFLLPANFNFFSIFIFLSLFLQIYFGYLIIYKITKNQLFSIFSSFLFIFTPIFLFKLKFHFSLISHWLILSYFYINFLNISYKEKKNKLLLLILISSLIHFYFTIMILLMVFISRTTTFYFDKKYFNFFKDTIFYLLPLLLLMYLVGYFMISPLSAIGGGYGHYNLNMIAFFNPNLEGVSWSKFIPIIYRDNSESFSYLGLGIILILVNLLFYLSFKFKKIDLKKNLSLIIIFFIFYILAVSNNIEFANLLIFKIELNKYLYGMLSIIRASTRMVWPCIYIILIFGIYSIFKSYSNKTSLILIFFLLCLQITDISNGIKQFKFGKIYNSIETKFNDERLKKINAKYEILSATNVYNENNDFHKLAPFLATFMPKTEIVYLSRIDRKKQSDLTYLNNSNFLNKKNNLDKFFYVQTLGHLNHLNTIYNKKDIGFVNFENIWFFLPKGKKLMNKEEKKFINNLNLNPLKTDQAYYLNNYDKFTKDKVIGLGWFYEKKDNKLYTDGERSFLIFNQKILKINKIKLNIGKAFNGINLENKIDIFINDNKINSFLFEEDFVNKNISIDLTKVDSEKIVIELKMYDPRSIASFRKGIDEKKKALILNSYTVTNY